MVIMGFDLSHYRIKHQIVLLLLQKPKAKTWERGGRCSELHFWELLEKESTSL